MTESVLALKRDERRRIRKVLQAAGFNPGPADGMFGQRTRGAIREWESSRAGVSTGYPDADSAKLLLASVEEPTPVPVEMDEPSGAVDEIETPVPQDDAPSYRNIAVETLFDAPGQVDAVGDATQRDVAPISLGKPQAEVGSTTESAQKLSRAVSAARAIADEEKRSDSLITIGGSQAEVMLEAEARPAFLMALEAGCHWRQARTFRIPPDAFGNCLVLASFGRKPTPISDLRTQKPSSPRCSPFRGDFHHLRARRVTN